MTSQHRPTPAWPTFRAFWVLCFLVFATLGAHARPAQVTTGTYVTKIQNLNFKDNSYTLDFYLWFRWKPEGALRHYQPLESFELVNGAIDSRSGIVLKTVGDTRYAAVRVAATMVENWALEKYPFDRHSMDLFIEDSTLPREQMEFVPDTANSGLGDELDLAGWKVSNFRVSTADKSYHSNYGDPDLPPQARSEFSRFVASVDIERQTFGSAVKLLSTVLLSVAVAFVAFLVKPSDLDARFGMGVGALFAVAASAYIASASVPDSGVMTTADFVHMAALMFIFCSLLISAVCLKLEVSGREQLAFSIDRFCAVVLPLLFYGWAALEIWRALH